MDNELQSQLIQVAVEARSFAYARYSKFPVGAALLCDDGTVFTGCNVENCVYGLAICAERVAMCKAISEGNRRFKAIAIAASPLAPPCGTCRQFMAEFKNSSPFEVISCDADDLSKLKLWTLEQLLPEVFRLDP